MEIILTLVKYLTSTLALHEFVIAFAVLCALVGIIVWVFIKYKADILPFFLKGDSPGIAGIKAKLDGVLTQADFNVSIANFELMVKHEFSATASELRALREKIIEVAQFQQELLNKDFLKVVNEIEDMRRVHDQRLELILASSIRGGETTARALSQIEKVDQLISSMIPEFRSYHREISSDIKLLSRDLALIERSIGLQINNTTSAIKLR